MSNSVMINGFSLWLYEVANGPPVASTWSMVVCLFISEVGSVQRVQGDDSISVPTQMPPQVFYIQRIKERSGIERDPLLYQKPLRPVIHFHQDPWKIKTINKQIRHSLCFSCWCPSDQMSSCNLPTTPSCSAPWVPCSIVAAWAACCRRFQRHRVRSCGKWCVMWPWRLGDHFPPGDIISYLMGIS